MPTDFHNVPRKAIGLKYIPRVDVLMQDISGLKPVVITDEGGPLTLAVKTKLEREGHKVVVIQFDAIKKNTSIKDGISIPEINDQHIKTVIDTILAKNEIGVFMYLHPHFTCSDHNFTQHFDIERSLLKATFLLAKYLQAPLNKTSKTQRTVFMTVSRLDGKFGMGKRSNISIIAGGLSGLTKCMNLEWSPVFCRAIDAQPELSPEAIASHLFLELHDADVRYIDVAINETGRMTYEVTPDEVSLIEDYQQTVTEKDVFLVAGGGRGVTATCIKEMSRVFKPKFILLGRSSLDFQLPAYVVIENDPAKLKNAIMQDLKASGEKVSIKELNRLFNTYVAKKEIEETIATIKAAGGDAVYVAGDVTNLTIKPELLKIEKQWGKITGIIHGAGRLADKLIQDKTEEIFDHVTSVKLDGLLNLLKMVNINELKHLIMFSSVAGFYGNVGQSDYAMANEILSTAAHLFSTNHPNTKVTAMNWGAWEGGMVSPELQKMFEEAGVSLVNHPGGAARFVQELNGAYHNQPQVIIGGTLPAGISDISGDLKTHTIQRNLSLKENMFLQHHVIQGSPVLPMVNATAWMTDSCVKLFPDYKLASIEDVKFFKGIVFDGTEKEVYFTKVKEQIKTTDSIVCEVSIYSKGAKLPLHHYRATVTLSRKRTDSPKFKTPKLVENKIDGTTFYTDGSLFHGAFYQGIETVLVIDEEQVLLKCKAPAVSYEDQGQFPSTSLNAFFLDIQYQGLIVWVQKFHNGANSLPLQASKAIIYGEIYANESYYVYIKIQENTETKTIADCTVYDENENVILFTQGIGLTVSQELVW